MLKKFLPVLLLLAVCLAQAAEFKAPVLLTSGGQSADLQLVKTLLTRENIAFNVKPLATAADLEQVGSVIIVLGGSSKGLGAAKVSAEEESARMTALLGAAQERKVPVLAIHVGGKNRRGALSDEFNRLGARGADELIVVAGGDDDGLFKGVAAERSILFEIAPKISDVGALLRARFTSVEPPKE